MKIKVKVIKPYRDKDTKIIHRVDEEIGMTQERYEEINSTSFGVFVEKIETESPPEEKEEIQPQEDETPIDETPGADGAPGDENPQDDQKKKGTKKDK